MYTMYTMYTMYAMYTMYTMYTIYTMYRTPSDIDFNALFNHGYHPIQPLRTNTLITRAPGGPQT